MLRRRHTRERLLWLAALAGGSVVSGSTVHAQDVRKLEQDLRDLETATQQMAVAPLRRQDLQSPTYVEERLTDGELFYRLKDYVRASIILTDVVDNYPQHPSVGDALFLLGESLYSAGDYLGARTRFRQLIARAEDPTFRPYASRSLGRLIEIAIRTRDFDGVEGYFERLARLPPQEVEAATAYFRAKYLYNKAVPTEDVTRGDTALKTNTVDVELLRQARQSFESVAESSPYYPQARYFVGVIYTLERQFPQAIEAFRRVAQAQVSTDEHAQVQELALLALGRLYYETDQLDQAIETYQSVPRTSKWFDVALYEIAWVYIRMGDSTRAERALEVLVIASPESKYIADGSILRGNLLLRNGQLEDAAKVFQGASNNYGPVRDKLDKVLVDHPDTQAYFRDLVRDNLEVFDANSILPAEAVPFATEEADLKRALDVLADMAEARALVQETTLLMRRLDDATNVPNTAAIFPDLRHHKERATALRNRAVLLRKGLIAAAEAKASTSSGELASLKQEREKLEAVVTKMPSNEDAFSARDEQLLGGFTGASRSLSQLEVELMGMEARITATERFLADTQDARTNAEGVHAMQSELTAQRGAVDGFRKQIEELKLQLEAGKLQVGVGDPRYAHDDQVRAQYLALVDRERALLGPQASALDGMFRRVASVEGNLDTRDAQIDKAVEERIADMKQVLAAEGTNVEGYRTQLGKLEGDAEDVVGSVTYANFAAVRRRFYDLVLRADVGSIDVSWADREEHRMRVELLTRERAREIQALDDEFQEIMDEPKGGEQ
jgi:TolA-binding protein